MACRFHFGQHQPRDQISGKLDCASRCVRRGRDVRDGAQGENSLFYLLTVSIRAAGSAQQRFPSRDALYRKTHGQRVGGPIGTRGPSYLWRRSLSCGYGLMDHFHTMAANDVRSSPAPVSCWWWRSFAIRQASLLGRSCPCATAHEPRRALAQDGLSRRRGHAFCDARVMFVRCTSQRPS